MRYREQLRCNLNSLFVLAASLEPDRAVLLDRDCVTGKVYTFDFQAKGCYR